MKILYAEDGQDLRELVTSLLTDEGHEVIEAQNGDEALTILRTSPDGTFDLVLTDVMMPKLTGLELVAIMRVDERFKNLPVIICSASHYKTSGYEECTFIPKPFDVAHLLDAIETLGKKESV